MKMFDESIFLPLINQDIPMINSFPQQSKRTQFGKNELIPKLNDVKAVAYLRQKLSEAIDHKKQVDKNKYKLSIERDKMVQ